MMEWKPSATLDVLRLRAAVISTLRTFFIERDVLEVETPMLYGSSATDPQLMSFTTQYLQQTLYLQTSPEFPMKRLLAAGSGSIYQIAKAFRNGENGRFHNPEFTMLEWYRPGFDHHQLMNEIQALLACVLSNKTPERKTYAEVFDSYLDIDPHRATIVDLQDCIHRHGLCVDETGMERDGYLDVLMSHCIEPYLGVDSPSFIYDFPASQAGLARLWNTRQAGGASLWLAERFEVYIQGMEIANAYHELTDAKEQKQRFIRDNETRTRLGLPLIPIDHYLLAALQQGLPASAGAALGVDRLVFLVAQAAGYPVESLADVLTFPVA